MSTTDYDAIIVGGGPSGATAANDLVMSGLRVLMIERSFRIKPCGGAIPPCLVKEFDIPQHLLVAKINSARMVAPSGTTVDMPVGDTYVGMVDRDVFDPWLRQRAVDNGAELAIGTFKDISYDADGVANVRFQLKDEQQTMSTKTAKVVIGADGARSGVARKAIPQAKELRWVFAYHEILKAPETATEFYDPKRCDVWYQGRFSPDFYAWVFPHGDKLSVGVGSELKQFSATASVTALREKTGMEDYTTVRREGAPIPLKPLSRWDDGRGVILAGDAAGVVAPASGEGIYYAMYCGRLVADSAREFVASGDPKVLRAARKQFMKSHGRTFWALGLLQRIWYRTDKRREKFVSMCKDKDVQELTWQAYTQKKLVRKKKAAHLRVFMKDLAQLMGFARA